MLSREKGKECPGGNDDGAVKKVEDADVFTVPVKLYRVGGPAGEVDHLEEDGKGEKTQKGEFVKVAGKGNDAYINGQPEAKETGNGFSLSQTDGEGLFAYGSVRVDIGNALIIKDGGDHQPDGKGETKGTPVGTAGNDPIGSHNHDRPHINADEDLPEAVIAIADGRSDIKEAAEEGKKQDWRESPYLIGAHHVTGDKEGPGVEEDYYPFERFRGDLVFLDDPGAADRSAGVGSLEMIEVIIGQIGGQVNHKGGNIDQDETPGMPGTCLTSNDPAEGQGNKGGNIEGRSAGLYPGFCNLSVHHRFFHAQSLRSITSKAS